MAVENEPSASVIGAEEVRARDARRNAPALATTCSLFIEALDDGFM